MKIVFNLKCIIDFVPSEIFCKCDLKADAFSRFFSTILFPKHELDLNVNFFSVINPISFANAYLR